MHIHVPVYVLSVCDCIILRFILPPSSRATTSPGFEGKTFWDNRSHTGMDRTRFYHKGSQLHSKLNKGIRAFILRDWRGCNFGQDKAKLAKNSSGIFLPSHIFAPASLWMKSPWKWSPIFLILTFWVRAEYNYLALTIPMDIS